MKKQGESLTAQSLARLKYTWYCICGTMCRDEDKSCPQCSRSRSDGYWDAERPYRAGKK